MSKLGLLIKNEYATDIKSKSFWIGTIVAPILFIAFSLVMGYVISDSETTKKLTNPTAPEADEMSGVQLMGMLAGMLLSLFLMIYGSQIYGKVKKEKVNRVMEVMATCVPGRTMMLAKVVSVGLLGFTQLLIWGAIVCAVAVGYTAVMNEPIPEGISTDPRIPLALIWTILFFIGGYIFYGAIYAACGAMTDKDNENQAYMTIITFFLLGSLYVGEYAVNHPDNPFILFCTFFPFTSPTIAAVTAVSGAAPFWQSLLSLGVLYLFGAISISLSGKIYTSSLLLKGRKFSPKDIITFLKAK